MRKNAKLKSVDLDDSLEPLETPGVYVLRSEGVGLFAGESQCIRQRIEQLLENERWQGLEPDSVEFVPE